MKTLLVLVLSCFMAFSALAVIDPDQDMLGIYFDLEADYNCITVAANTPFLPI